MAMLNTFIVIRQCLLRLVIISYLQSTIKYGKRLDIEFDSEPVYGDGDKYIKTKIKTYEDGVNSNFQGKKVPKENASYKCLSLIMLDFVIRANKRFYPQTLLEECKYVIRKNQMGNPINNNLILH